MVQGVAWSRVMRAGGSLKVSIKENMLEFSESILCQYRHDNSAHDIPVVQPELHPCPIQRLVLSHGIKINSRSVHHGDHLCLHPATISA